MKKILTIFFILPVFFFTETISAEPSLAARLAEARLFQTSSEFTRLSDLLQRSMAAYEAARDYQAIFYKQEISGEKMGPKEQIFLKFEKPFKIYMGWMNTHKQGLQVLYERGRHDGKLAIHKPGLLLGLAPVIFLDQNSPWVKEGSESYDIEDAGIGSFLYDFAEMCARGAEEKKLSVKMDTSKGSEVFDVSFPGSKKEDKGFFSYRVVVQFDDDSHLPVKMDLYDWDNKPTGYYAYENLKVDSGLNDPEFKKFADRSLYNLFVPKSSAEPFQKSRPKNNFASRKKLNNFVPATQTGD